MTPGGSPSTHSNVNLIPLDGTNYAFSAMSGEVLARVDANVGDVGIPSQGDAHSVAVMLLTVNETANVSMTGTCGSSTSGALSTSSCVAILVGGRGIPIF